MARKKTYFDYLRQELSELIDQLDLPDLQKQSLKHRWLDQVVWADKKADQCRRAHYRLRITTIVGGVLLPALVGLNFQLGKDNKFLQTWFPYVPFVLSQVIAVSAAAEEFFRYGDRWREYRQLSEDLKAEGWQFLQLSGPYQYEPSVDVPLPPLRSETPVFQLQDFQSINLEMTSQQPTTHRASFRRFTGRIESLIKNDVESYITTLQQNQAQEQQKVQQIVAMVKNAETDEKNPFSYSPSLPAGTSNGFDRTAFANPIEVSQVSEAEAGLIRGNDSYSNGAGLAASISSNQATPFNEVAHSTSPMNLERVNQNQDNGHISAPMPLPPPLSSAATPSQAPPTVAATAAPLSSVTPAPSQAPQTVAATAAPLSPVTPAPSQAPQTVAATAAPLSPVTPAPSQAPASQPLAVASAPVENLDLNMRLLNAAKKLQGMSTADGPGGGRIACGWTLNKVIQEAGITSIGQNPNFVPEIVKALQEGRGRQVTPETAKAGDLVVAAGEEHIGVALTDGCTEVISNSSSRACFSWVADKDFDGYYGGSSTIYRLLS